MIRQVAAFAVALVSWASTALGAETRIDAEVQLTTPNPPFGTTAITVSAIHKAVIVEWDAWDAGKPFLLYGKLYEKQGLFFVLQDECQRSAPAADGLRLECKTEVGGQCDVKYQAKTDAGIDYGWWGNGPGDTDLKEGSGICNYATTPTGPVTPGCEPDSCTPIVVDLDAGGFRFTGLDAPVLFDIDADGEAERISWTDPAFREAFLVLDRNGNGQVDDGSELFGAATDQPPSAEPNGFAALGVFDDPAWGGDGDGWLSAGDAVFAALRLWIDADHDGRSQPGELSSLGEQGVEGIELDRVVSNRRDRHGNRLRWASHVQFGRGRRLAAADVIFLSE